MFSPPTGQTPSHGSFANFDAFGSGPGSSAFGSIPPVGQAAFQAQPAPPGKCCPSGFLSFWQLHSTVHIRTSSFIHIHTSPENHTKRGSSRKG